VNAETRNDGKISRSLAASRNTASCAAVHERIGGVPDRYRGATAASATFTVRSRRRTAISSAVRNMV
jgi:hypothetical protein